jgi:hypothetical protein
MMGRVVDGESGEALPRATLQLYKLSTKRERTDTTFFAGALADEAGRFVLSGIGAGTYVLKASFLGYQPLAKRLTKRDGGTLTLGNVAMQAEAVVVSEAVVTANVPKMVVKDDTVVFNADAFRVPEGSVIESLVEMLPGAKIDDNGGITINGKEVKRFKMDGRDFMTGNNQTVMKNLPSYVVDQVKAYDEKSDLSRLTGVDDGNDDFVLEFVTKRSARKGLQMNPDVGIGTDGRYGIRLTAMKPFGDTRYTFMGNANNVNDRNFSGRGGRGRGNGNGERTTKTGALDLSYESPRRVEGRRESALRVNGRVTWTHTNTDNWSRTGSENFVLASRGGAFSNSISQSYSRNNNWTANMNLQWALDSVTTLSVRPNMSFSTNDSRSFSTSASFNADPFDYVADALSDKGRAEMDRLGLIVNDRQNKSLGYGSNKNLSTQLQLFRRFGSKGRNLAVSGNVNYRNGSNRNANLSAVRLYQTPDMEGNDSTYQTNRYTASPSDNFSYSLGATYTEPLWSAKPKEMEPGEEARPSRRGERRQAGAQGLFLQLNYRYSYSHQKNDPSTYDFPDYSDEAFADVLGAYRECARLFGYLDNPYDMYLSDRLSRFS